LSENRYLVALGSNMGHPRIGPPKTVLAAAMQALSDNVGNVTARSSIISSAPVGPSIRHYANAALVLDCDLSPPEMLEALQRVERSFGRERRGQRWRARTLDLDIILWSGGCWNTPHLQIPHPLMRQRDFVLGPAAAIAGDWRDPKTSLSLRHLFARLTRRTLVPR